MHWVWHKHNMCSKIITWALYSVENAIEEKHSDDQNAIEKECNGDKNDRVYKLNDRVCKKKGKLKAKWQHLT